MKGPGALHWIRPDDPPDAFPDPRRALHEPDGLLAVGGDLSPARLLAAYRRGIFPWYETGQPILWWSPDPRAVLVPGELKISTSLRKTLRAGRLHVTLDSAFTDVVGGCAAPRTHQRGTWLTPDMQHAYERLHEMGYAHSIEVWNEDERALAGGLYGVALGRVFFGESMFSRVRDASKVALVRLVDEARTRGFELIDCQVHSQHLASLGSRTMARHEFLRLLDRLCDEAHPCSWSATSPAHPTHRATQPPAED